MHANSILKLCLQLSSFFLPPEYPFRRGSPPTFFSCRFSRSFPSFYNFFFSFRFFLRLLDDDGKWFWLEEKKTANQSMLPLWRWRLTMFPIGKVNIKNFFQTDYFSFLFFLLSFFFFGELCTKNLKDRNEKLIKGKMVCRRGEEKNSF